MSFYKLPRLIQLLATIALINVVLFSVFRLAFWIYFNDPTDPVSSQSLWYAFYVGFKFDLRLALFILLPVFLLGWYQRISPLHSKMARIIWLSYLTVLMYAVYLFYILNAGHFAYLQMPLDATAMRFLDNPRTSALMVWQTYPVLWITLAMLVATALYTFALNKLMLFYAERPVYSLRKRIKVAVVTATTLLAIFGMYGKFSWYPLRWSDAFASSHPFASAVTVNPILYSLTTFKNRDVEFDAELVASHYDDMVDYLGIDTPDKDNLSFKRLGQPNALAVTQAKPRPNVVIVILESFANYKSSLSGNPIDPTPKLAAIAKDGIYFNNFFTPHAGTARSVFTAVTGLPDVEKVKTSTRNPLIVNQHTIVNEFKNYKKFYFLGGSASWGNIRGLLSYNIPDLDLYEEGRYNAPRVDVWGLSDLHLFEEAHQVLKTQKEQPFFAIIQTSGNHRPYTIPEDNGGFVFDNRDEAEITRYGFQSSAEYNSFRYMDHSIGHFMEMARQGSYFDNTIFVFFGDHGIYANPGEHSIKAEMQLALNNIRVPLVFYAPNLLPKGLVVDKMASEVDVLPTVAGLTLDQYVNTTMGRDLFDERFDQQRFAFTAINESMMHIGLISNDYYFRMYEDGSSKVLHKIDSESPRENVMPQHADVAAEMERISRGIYESTRYMRYHNARR
ncbi:LTA synthase family protein [Kaarinaea lacus]